MDRDAPLLRRQAQRIGGSAWLLRGAEHAGHGIASIQECVEHSLAEVPLSYDGNSHHEISPVGPFSAWVPCQFALVSSYDISYIIKPNLSVQSAKRVQALAKWGQILWLGRIAFGRQRSVQLTFTHSQIIRALKGDHMAGRNFLFVPGPTNVPDRVLRAMAFAMEDHRSPIFPELTRACLSALKPVLNTTTRTPILFPSSVTPCCTAALTNCLSPGDKILTSRFGQFSHLWADMCERLGFEVELLETPWGEGAPVERYLSSLEQDKQHKIKAVLVCQNETATGVTSDVAAIRKAMDSVNHPALLFLDSGHAL